MFQPLSLGNKRTLHFSPHLHYHLVPCIWGLLSFWYFFTQLTLERDLNYMGPLILGLFSIISTYSATWSAFVESMDVEPQIWGQRGRVHKSMSHENFQMCEGLVPPLNTHTVQGSTLLLWLVHVSLNSIKRQTRFQAREGKFRRAFFCFWGAAPHSMWDLSSQPRMNPAPRDPPFSGSAESYPLDP